MAERWASAGAKLIHLVDLDGSLGRSEPNKAALSAIRKRVASELELGGGLRDMDSMAAWLDLGVDKIILGTAVCLDQPLVEKACSRWPGRVLAALDAKGGRLRIRGWLEDGGLDILEAAKGLKNLGVSRIIHTDVERDGTRQGPNLTMAAEVAKVSGLPTVISGGVANVSDLKTVAESADRDLFYGVISGKALYEGTLAFEAGQLVLSGLAHEGDPSPGDLA